MKYTPSRAALGTVACLAIVLAGLAMVTPAGATLRQEAQAVAKQNWSKIWKKKLQNKADKRYWTKAQADSRYAGKADSYTKPESDAKYQDKQQIYRGTYLVGAPSTAAGAYFFGDLSYGVTLAAAPTAHYIKSGAAVPPGCSGTAAAPSAEPGHLCVFESTSSNVGATRNVANLAFTPDTATPTGAWLYATTVGASFGYFGGSWAMQPGGAATVSSRKASPSFGPTVGRLR